MTTTEMQVLQDTTSTGRVIDWKGRKMANEYLAMAFDQIDSHIAARLRSCASFLHYGVEANGRRRLRAANFCRVRLCPICQWRRSLKLYSQMRAAMDYLAKKDCYAYLFLTLTIPNVKLDKLPDALDDMAAAFNLFRQYKEIKQIVKGWYRGVEVTHNLDRSSPSFDTFHPHIHVILAVNKSYFTSQDYLSQARITELWARAIGANSYTPVVDIRKVKGDTAKAVCEATKYAAKSKDYLVFDDWDLTIETVRGLADALHRRRLVGFGGCMLEARRALDLEDPDSGELLLTSADDQGSDKDIYFESYAWHTGFSQYIRAE